MTTNISLRLIPNYWLNKNIQHKDQELVI